MLQFAHPEILWFLLAIPVLGFGFAAVNLWRGRLLRRFLSDTALSRLAPDRSSAKRAVKQGVVLAGLACLILAAANPQVGTRMEEVRREG
ncbi:MAG: BatB protein, partial [Bacteroidota bacterium]